MGYLSVILAILISGHTLKIKLICKLFQITSVILKLFFEKSVKSARFLQFHAVPSGPAPQTSAQMQRSPRNASGCSASAAIIGGLSHDVRSFATRLQLRLHLIDDTSERARAESDIADMVHLLDDALLAVCGGAGALEQEMIDWNDLVRDTAEPYLRTGAAVSLDAHPHPSAHGAFVIGDRLSLRRILANLIDNALKYGGKAEISTTADPTRIMCFVDDAGPGIPASQRQILLEPFARLESSRNRGTGGAGLGLAIVKTLVEAHDGSVAIEESPLGGTRIAVSLPRFQTAFAASEIDPRQTAAFAISR